MTALFAVIFGPDLAVFAGPYVVIIIGANVGAAWSLGRRPVTSRGGAFKHFLLMSSTAIIFTVPLAEWIGMKLGSQDARWLFAPIAMLIGGVGGDWPRLLRWLGRRFYERKVGSGQEVDK